MKPFAEQEEELIEKVVTKVSGNGIYGLFGIRDAAREMAQEKNKTIRKLAEALIEIKLLFEAIKKDGE